MVQEENGASGAKNIIIPETTIFTDFHVTCHLTGTFIITEFFGLCPDIKKSYKKIRINKEFFLVPNRFYTMALQCF